MGAGLGKAGVPLGAGLGKAEFPLGAGLGKARVPLGTGLGSRSPECGVCDLQDSQRWSSRVRGWVALGFEDSGNEKCRTGRMVF